MDMRHELVLKTIVWFDIFNFPLTLEEIFWYQPAIDWPAAGRTGNQQATGQPLISQNDLVEILADLIQQGILNKQGDFYFLNGRQEIVKTRRVRYEESLKKINYARQAAKILSLLPFIRAAAVCNVLGYFNAKLEDDIDFLVLTAKGRIWTVRLLVAGIFKILGLRANPQGRIQDRFCFSFYAAEDGFNLETLKLAYDPYLVWWLGGLLPIYDQKDYFDRFLQANQWAQSFLPNLKQRYNDQQLKKYKIKNWLTQFKTLAERMVPEQLEKISKKIQLKIMPPILKEEMAQERGVVINNSVLKFHLQDRREEFAKEFEKRIKKIKQD